MASKVYGYARVSTMKQRTERQIANIKSKCPDAIIFEEAFTGTKMDRPKWNKLIKELESGATIVFDEVSRLSRDAEEGFSVYKELYEKGVNLIFLKEPTLNTEHFKDTIQIALTGETIADMYIDTTNKVLLLLAEKQIKSAFESAQNEVEFLRKRIEEGLQEAKRQGKRIGTQKGDKLITKKSIKSKELILKHSKDFGGSLNDAELMKMTNLSRNTFYKYKRQLRDEL